MNIHKEYSFLFSYLFCLDNNMNNQNNKINQENFFQNN